MAFLSRKNFRKNSSVSVKLDAVRNSHTTAATDTMAGSVTASPAKKLARQRAKKVFLTR